MRRFQLHRDEDLTGISGTGVVAEGVQWSTGGQCVYRWLTATSTTTFADSIADVEAIHGHDGRTRVVWLDEE